MAGKMLQRTGGTNPPLSAFEGSRRRNPAAAFILSRRLRSMVAGIGHGVAVNARQRGDCLR